MENFERFDETQVDNFFEIDSQLTSVPKKA